MRNDGPRAMCGSVDNRSIQASPLKGPNEVHGNVKDAIMRMERLTENADSLAAEVRSTFGPILANIPTATANSEVSPAGGSSSDLANGMHQLIARIEKSLELIRDCVHLSDL